MLFVWDETFVPINVVHWKTFFIPVRSDFHDYLAGTYNIGYSLPLIVSPYKTLENFAIVDRAFQLFISPETSTKSNHVSTTIPSISATNPSIIGLLTYRKLKAYCHASLGINIANPNYQGYIGNLLSYCSSHGFLGVVFHCGKTSRYSVQESIQHMKDNIILGIRSKSGLFSKFLLETPAGQANELFPNVCDFFNFVRELLAIPDIAPHIAVCIDTCHVFSCDYDPYNYLKEAYNNIPVGLVHFNDSKNTWNARVDRHEISGRGFIPYPLLEKVAYFAKSHGIDMIFEYNT